MGKSLSYDEQKAAEAAFRGQPCDARWSASARAVYDGIIKAKASSDLSEGMLSEEEVLSHQG